MATLRKRQTIIGGLKRALEENLNFAVKAAIEDLTQEEIYEKTADQVIEISKKINDLHEICNMDYADIRTNIVSICREWDCKRMEELDDF